MCCRKIEILFRPVERRRFLLARIDSIRAGTDPETRCTRTRTRTYVLVQQSDAANTDFNCMQAIGHRAAA